MSPPRQSPRRVLRAGGSLRSGSRFTVQAAQFRRLFVAPHHSARSTAAGCCRDGLTKPAFCHRSPLFFAAVAASGRSLRSLRAAARRILAALAGGVRSNRQGLSAAVRTTRQQVHIIASHIYRCGSKAAEHDRYCKFCDTVSLRKFFSPSAVLSARQTVF